MIWMIALWLLIGLITSATICYVSWHNGEDFTLEVIPWLMLVMVWGPFVAVGFLLAAIVNWFEKNSEMILVKGRKKNDEKNKDSA